MEIKTKYNIGDKVYFLNGMNIFSATINTINIKIDKSFKDLHFNIGYDIIVHDGHVNFTPKASPIGEEFLFKSESELINNIKIIK